MIAHSDVVHGNIGASAFGIEYNVIALDSADGYIAGLAASCRSITGNKLLNIDFAIGGHSADGTIKSLQAITIAAGYTNLAIQNDAALIRNNLAIIIYTAIVGLHNNITIRLNRCEVSTNS